MIMTANEADAIDLNTETNVQKLRELVKYWQNKAIEATNTIGVLEKSFSNEDLSKKGVNVEKAKQIIT